MPKSDDRKPPFRASQYSLFWIWIFGVLAVMVLLVAGCAGAAPGMQVATFVVIAFGLPGAFAVSLLLSHGIRPRYTLVVEEDAIVATQGDRVRGRIPFANVREIRKKLVILVSGNGRQTIVADLCVDLIDDSDGDTYWPGVSDRRRVETISLGTNYRGGPLKVLAACRIGWVTWQEQHGLTPVSEDEAFAEEVRSRAPTPGRPVPPPATKAPPSVPAKKAPPAEKNPFDFG